MLDGLLSGAGRLMEAAGNRYIEREFAPSNVAAPPAQVPTTGQTYTEGQPVPMAVNSKALMIGGAVLGVALVAILALKK